MRGIHIRRMRAVTTSDLERARSSRNRLAVLVLVVLCVLCFVKWLSVRRAQRERLDKERLQRRTR